MNAAIEELKNYDKSDTLAVSPSEGMRLYECVQECKPKTILEVGTGHGYSTSWIALAMRGDALLITIDHNDYADLIHKDYLKSKKIIQTIGELPDILPRIPNKIDFAFLDSQHQIEKIVADIELIYPRLSDGATVVIHDTIYCEEMGRCLRDYFNGEDTKRLKDVGVCPSDKNWTYEEFTSEYGLGIAKMGKGNA